MQMFFIQSNVYTSACEMTYLGRLICDYLFFSVFWFLITHCVSPGTKLNSEHVTRIIQLGFAHKHTHTHTHTHTCT